MDPANSPAAAARCARCGATSATDAGYQKLWGQLHCPVCARRRRAREGAWMWISLPVMAALGLLLMWHDPRDPVGPVVVNLALFFSFQVLTILPHEAGHALAARALGLRVFRIILGAGRRVARFRIGGTVVEVRPVPLGGATVFGARGPSLFRLRLFLTALAGPLANVALLGAAILLARPPAFSALDPFRRVAPLADFVYATALLLLINLFPRKVAAAGALLDSDGLLLAKAFFLPAERREELLAATYGLEGWTCLEEGKPSEALEWYEKGLRAYPASAVLKNDRGVARLRLGLHELARESFLELRGLEKLKPEIRALAHNNVAVVDLYLLPARKDLLPEADRESEEARRLMGWLPAIKGTRGAVLIELGRTEEGLKLAREAFEANEIPAAKAFNAAYLALGLKALGRTDEARKYLEQARALDPTCGLLSRVSALL